MNSWRDATINYLANFRWCRQRKYDNNELRIGFNAIPINHKNKQMIFQLGFDAFWNLAEYTYICDTDIIDFDE